MTGRAVSTWSLHRTLGRSVADEGPSFGLRPTGPTDGLPLLELPAQLAAHGYDTVQICHFHLPTRDPGYLAELRSALGSAGITLDAVLVDAGDLVDPEVADDHERWIAGWLSDAAALGARRARLVAGQQPPTEERLAESARRLRRLAAGRSELRVVTENWLALLPSAPEVHRVLELTEGTVGLLIDLGNWTGPDKYEQLASIASLAETCHAKCHSRGGAAGLELDTADYRRSLGVLREAGYSGPLALIYDGPDDDEWAALDAEHAIVAEVFG
ncbi:MAG TPA: TIM barrel protein [Microlunatus sp.]|nr:TIM barrel protein [Microlunatus sp.]